jgi:hypothetical protein
MSEMPGQRPYDDRDPYADGLGELPPNIPPGFLGESGPDLRKVDGDGPHGLNAGIVQEWTWETTMLVVVLLYALAFPLAFVVLWRSTRVPLEQKRLLTVLMVAGLLAVGYVLLR